MRCALRTNERRCGHGTHRAFSSLVSGIGARAKIALCASIQLVTKHSRHASRRFRRQALYGRLRSTLNRDDEQAPRVPHLRTPT